MIKTLGHPSICDIGSRRRLVSQARRELRSSRLDLKRAAFRYSPSADASCLRRAVVAAFVTGLRPGLTWRVVRPRRSPAIRPIDNCLDGILLQW